MVTVYFESANHSEQVATFEDEKLYMLCISSIKQEAKEQGMIVTESINEN